jgi:Na+/phosphate symporter
MKNKMKMPVLFMLASLLIALPGCAAAAAWWQEFEANPAAQVNTFEQTVNIVISDATIAFGFVKPLLPANIQAQAQTDFSNGVVTVNHALQVLSDAVQAAVDAKTSSPDFSGAITAVENAVTQVLAIIDQYKAQVPPAAAAGLATAHSSAPGLAEAHDAAKSLTRYSGKF